MSLAQLKKIGADVVAVGTAVGSVLAVVVNVAHSVSLPAPDIAIIVGAASIVAAIVNVIKPLVAPKAKALFKKL